MDIQVNSRKNIRFFITGHYDFLGGFWESENFKYFESNKMKILIFFLPMVISFDYYYISNNKIFICGNKSESPFNFNWYEAQSGFI